MNNNCRVCNSPVDFLFKKKILFKYDVSYYHCNKCKYIQTEEPYWLEIAYSNAISSLDVGLMYRNIINADFLEKKFHRNKPNEKYLDYAGGYGILVRLMRDKGYDFYLMDKYCDNIFAQYFNLLDYNGMRFKAITAFEFMEHTLNPIKELELFFTYTNTLIFTTDIYPNNLDKVSNWWYLACESGQHIGFFNKNTLLYLAAKFGKNFYSKNNYHVITSDEDFFQKKEIKILKKIDIISKLFPKYLDHHKVKLRESLLSNDYNLALKKIIENEK